MFRKIRFLSGAQLKSIAMVSMLADHVNKALIYPILNGGVLLYISNLLDIWGRIAFPLFCFLLVEGFFKTQNRRKYLLTLLFFGIVSEIPFDLFTSGCLFNFNWNNVIFTLALVLLVLWCIDALKPKLHRALWFFLSAAIVALAALLSMLLGLDYEHHAILIGYFFYLFRDLPPLAIPFGFLSMYKEPWALSGFLLTLCYNGERGPQNKLFNYWFYPVHMLILGMLRIILEI